MPFRSVEYHFPPWEVIFDGMQRHGFGIVDLCSETKSMSVIGYFTDRFLNAQRYMT